MAVTVLKWGTPVETFRTPNPDGVSAIEKLFPSYESLPHNAIPWEDFSSYLIIFEFETGRALVIHSDGKKWTNLQGSFPINGDLEKTLKRLRTQKDE